MMTAYRSNGEPVILTADKPWDALPADVIWLDLSFPTREEDGYAERLTGIQVPTRDDLRDIEPSSRLYADEHAVYLTGSLVCYADTPRPVLTDVAFVLTPACLVTVRYDNPKSFALFASAICRVPGGVKSAPLMLLKMASARRNHWSGCWARLPNTIASSPRRAAASPRCLAS
jgi:magnesium transporter